MCFSATSSFVVASGLAVAGIAALKKVSHAKQIPLALAPLGCAIQQAAEGVVWLTLSQPDSVLHSLGMYIFLFFAYVVWPVWVPFALRQYEQDSLKRTLLALTQIVGVLFGTATAFVLLTSALSVRVVNGHLAYNIPHTYFGGAGSIALYLVPVILPFYIASNRILRIMGLLLTLALGITYFFAQAALPSVWCFFAAVISVGVLGIVWNGNKKE